MIKFGNRRINTGLITGYFPSGSKSIEFHFLAQNLYEKIRFESTEKRDEMLEALDNYLVAWEDGKPKMDDLTNLVDIINKFQKGPEEGGPPPGATVQ